MPVTDYYSILNISQNATAKEIKKAYRFQAKKFHPDSSSAEGSVEIFKAINEAYNILSDPVKKKEYDASLPKPEPQPPPRQTKPHSSSRTDQPPRSRAAAGRAERSRQVWREHNASIRTHSRSYSSRSTYNGRVRDSTSFRSFKSYKRWQRSGAYVGVFIVTLFVIFLIWALSPPSNSYKGRGDGYTKNLAGIPEMTSPRYQEPDQQIRTELYNELIVQPEIEKHIEQSFKNQLRENLNASPAYQGEKEMFPSGQGQSLADEIWNDIQDQ